MTGTIKSLDSANSSGTIAGADGLVVGFRPSAVLAYDVPSLAVGRVVSFDLESGRHPQAVNVCVVRSPEPVDRRLDATCLRYLGFRHEGGVRCYCFELFAPGEARVTFTVTSDLALFVKHHVGLQEGPGLCLHLLAAALDLAGTAAGTPSRCSLTDREMLAYLAGRPAQGAKRAARHGLPASGAAPDTACP